MDDSWSSISQKLPSEGAIKYESHIEDICNSLRMFSQVMIPHQMINSDKQIIQLMSKSISWRNKEHLIFELNDQSPEDLGKIFAHVLIAVHDKQDVLEEIHELCTDDIVSSLSAECKKLNFRYNITEYSYSKSINVSFLIHLLCNAPTLQTLNVPTCNIRGVTLKKIFDALYEEGVVLELRYFDISNNILNYIKGSSLATLLAVAPKLNDLDMRNCSLSGAVMDDMVKECSSWGVVLELTCLTLSENNLKDIKGSSLAMLLCIVAPKLNALYLSNCSLSGAVMDDMVKECSIRGVVLELICLNISENNLKDIKGSSLFMLLDIAPKLDYLYVSDCSLAGVDDMVKECSSREVVLEL
ncbi:uncharacterized protein LOC117117337 isoform X2 [Anneissia japonica]|nr:uncharacterized protein LOC117117337 isoform X2 [Anneissia japonica]